MSTYYPNPIITGHIILPVDLLPLIEELAKNNHEEWSLNRIKEGWTYGIKRCDDKKQHPCLIAYEELSESEKEYDRISAVATIKLLIALGYKISL